MSILLILSLLFIWLIVRELNSPKELDNFSKGYITLLVIFALVSGYPFIDHWRFESKLSSSAKSLADNRPAKVKCATVFESVYDKFGIAGTGDSSSGDIVLQYPLCNDLRDYLASPEKANSREISSLHTFTREAMHARGELNKQKASCQAVQRMVRSARKLGVLLPVAEQNSKDFYSNPYRSDPNFTEECAPGMKLDEDLNDTIW